MIRAAMYFTLMISIQTSVLRSQSLPDWVEEMPQDSKYYWARESVGIRGLSEEEYKEKANIRALSTISMQIRTTVSGQTTSSLSEQMTGDKSSFKDDFREESSTSTIADIQGAERVGEHVNSTTYWVLWRLDKSVHAENMEEFVEAATNQYEGFVEWPSDDPVGQLQYLIPAYEAIIKVAGVPAMFDGKNLKSEIPNQISKILNSLKLQTDGGNEFTGQTGYALGRPLKIKIKPKKNFSISDIPILFRVESGELSLSKETVLTDPSGKANINVTNILSQKSTQQIRAFIDLKQWREDQMAELISFENRLDEISLSNSVLFTLDVKKVTQEKIAVITVGDTSVFNEDDLKRVNSDFRSEFADVTDFKLKDEMLVEPIIESYKRSASLCSNEECQIEIGKKLGVERLVFVDVANYPKQTTVTIFLRNIGKNELELQYGYDFPHDEWKGKAPTKPSGYRRARLKMNSAEEKYETGEMTEDDYYRVMSETEEILGDYEKKLQKYNDKFEPFKDNLIYEVLDNIPDMVEDFWVRTNPGKLTLNCRTRGVKADFTYLGRNKWFEKNFDKRLPFRDERFLEGTYEIDVEKLGYEKYHMRFDVAMGEFPVHEIRLSPKRAGKAFLRSLFIPGRGQIYSSDEEHRGRFVMGLTYFLSTTALSAVSGVLWNEFFTAKDSYDATRLEYLEAVEIDDIALKQSTMLSAHSTMSEKRNTAVLVTGITAGIWLFNAIDAALFFPAEYKGRRLSMNASPEIYANTVGAKTKLVWSF